MTIFSKKSVKPDLDCSIPRLFFNFASYGVIVFPALDINIPIGSSGYSENKLSESMSLHKVL